MTRLSPAAVLAWKMAAFEALREQSEFIEKEHLLIGLYSLEKVLGIKDFARAAKAAQTVLEEKDALDFPLCNSGMDPVTLRRRIRQAIPRGVSRHESKTIHRSRECKNIFSRAEQMAQGYDVTCIHLLSAILESPGQIILNVIENAPVVGTVAGGRTVTATIMQSVKEFQTAQEWKKNLSGEIEHSRRTLPSVSRDSEHYRQLKRDLTKMTARLALICIDTNDLSGLIQALRSLSHDTSVSHQELLDLMPQLEYMNKEGIWMGEQTKKRIKEVLSGIGGN